MTFPSEINKIFANGKNAFSNKLLNVPAAGENIDRLYNTYQYPMNPYEATGMGMGMGMGISPMYVPHNMYQHQYNLKLGGATQDHGYSYGSPETHDHHSYEIPMKKMKSKKGYRTALSALTLLAFLYFLNLLQSCLKDHINAMNPTVLVMTAGSREGNINLERIDTEDYSNRSFDNNKEMRTHQINGDKKKLQKDRNFILKTQKNAEEIDYDGNL